MYFQKMEHTTARTHKYKICTVEQGGNLGTKRCFNFQCKLKNWKASQASYVAVLRLILPLGNLSLSFITA